MATATKKPKAIKEKKINPPAITEPPMEEPKKDEVPEEPVIETPTPEETIPEEEIKEPVIEDKVEEMVTVGKMSDGTCLDVPKNKIAELKIEKDELSMEQRIEKFIESKGVGEIKMNDFLKSLYPVPKFGEPATWLQQPINKELRVLLDKMWNEGRISLVNASYQQLGRVYYPDHSTGKAEYHNLNDTVIIAQK